jgi:sodium pump decarboxylase gamma subunit
VVELEAEAVSNMQMLAENYINAFSEMTDEDLATQMAAATKSKDYTMETAFKSWESVKGDLGALVSYETATVTLGDEGYIARINAVYELRNMEMTLMVDEEFTTIQGVSFSPDYTTGEKMAKAGMNTLMGMGVVFVVLIFISWVIGMFKYISVFEAKMKAKNAPAPAPAPAAAPAPVAAPVVEEEEYVDDTELISVIAAAIAASEGKTSANGLVVRSIKRVSNRSWK